MAHVDSFEDLEVYKLARRLARELYELSMSFPKEEKLTDADGEQHETRHWALSALDSKLWGDDTADRFLKEYKIVGKQLQTMIDKSGGFCN